MRPLPAPVILAVMLAAAAPARADDAAADFSANANPSGAWRWGWARRLGEPFTAGEGYPSAAHIHEWRGAGGAMVLMNRTAQIQSIGTAVLLPGQLTLHPGEQGQLAVVRWTAAHAGTVRVDAEFSRADHVFPTTTDVHVLRDGAVLFDGAIDAVHARAPFRSLVSVRAGATIDFAVGWGANGNWRGDNTGLRAAITWVDAAP